MASGLALDIRLAGRALLRTRAVSIPAVLSLALAVGANVLVFAFVNSLLLRPLPVADPRSLTSVTSDFAVSHGFGAGAGWSYTMWDALRQRSAAFAGVLAWAPQRLTVGTPGDGEPVDGIYASGEFFSTLGVTPALGRPFTVEDDRSGAPVAVISHRLWLRRFGGTTNAIGAALLVDGTRTTVVGVTPAAFSGLEVGKAADVILPIGTEATIRGRSASLRGPRNNPFLVMLRLRPGQSRTAATAALRLLQPEIVPASAPLLFKAPFVLVAADGTASGPASPQRAFRQPILIMLGGVMVVLVICCLNIANLLLARAIARQRELAVRVALGASRWGLARPFLIESLMLSAAGSAIGLLLAVWGKRWLGSQYTLALDLDFDWRVVSFTAAVTLLTAFGFGAAPARRAAAANPAAALKDTSLAARPARLSNALVVLQIALALTLVVAAALFVRTLVRLGTRPLGFDADRILVAIARTTRERFEPEQHGRVSQQLADAARAVPGVERAAASLWTPLSGAGQVISVKSPTALPTENGVNVLANFVGPGWFAAYGIPLKAGRDFGDQDRARVPRVVIVNDAFVRRFVPQGNAVGTIVDGDVIVGIAGDAVYRTTRTIPGVTSLALREPVAPTIYAPLAQLPLWDRPPTSAIRISVRTTGGRPTAVARAVAAALAASDPNLLIETRPLSDDVDASLAQERMSAAAAGFFGVFSLLLAALGIYGVTSYTVSRRTREIGLRMALGTTPPVVIRLFLKRALQSAGLGVAIGLAGAAVAGRFFSSLLYGISAVDPATLVLVSVALLLVVTIAALIPARRAARVDPWVSLRVD